VGTHEQARIDHEKKIAKHREELAPVETAILKEQSAEAAVDGKIAELALKAAQGDRAALKLQRELRVRKDEFHLQVENLQSLAAPIRKAVAIAESELPRFVMAEVHERAADVMRQLDQMGVELSKVIQPIARVLGEFRVQVDAGTAEALALIARGDPDRIQALENRVRTMLVRGIRAQLSFEFRSVGLDLFEVGQFEGKDFQSVVRPVLESVISALEVGLYDGVKIPGRGRFRCLTRIAGLFGLHLLPGEIVSLPVEHKSVRKMIEFGSLELIGEPTSTNSEEPE